VHLKITTAPLYPPRKTINVLIEHRMRRMKSDSDGRLHIELDGGYHSVGIGTAPRPAGEPPQLASAPFSSDFQISDHRTFQVFQRAIETQALTLGEGNGDGHANPGEQIVILFPDGDAFRAAELFSQDSCLDLAMRRSDNWATYDHVGASAKYTLAKISQTCPTGHVITLRASVLFPNKPNHQLHESTLEIRVQ
jgi:hypothetical protein